MTLGAPAAGQDPAPAPERRPPNVVLVYADDMGFGDLAANDPRARIPLPNLARLVREGTNFTDAHSSSGICSPSRFALLTGTYHWRRAHGIVDSFGPPMLRDEDVTLAEVLRGAGYDTACIGKWHLGWDWSALRRKPEHEGPAHADDFDWTRRIPGGPLAHGFDHYFGDDVPNFPPYAWIRDDRVVEAPTMPLIVSPSPTEGSAESRPGPMAEGWRQDAVMPRLTARALAWLAEPARRERPFFLYWAWTAPHAPITPAAEFRGATEVGGYGDFLHQSDHHLGQLLDALDTLGFAQETLVVFTSDNGPEHYAYVRARDLGHTSAGPLRGVKRDLFEGGHRVPFVVRWPDVIPAGQSCAALVGQIDVLPTLARAAGVVLPAGAARDGLDLLDLWRGVSGTERTELVHNTFADHWAFRSGPWLLIDAADGAHTKVPSWVKDSLPTPDGPGLLYDLSTDRGQVHNLFAARPDVVAALRAQLGRARQ